MAPRPRKRKKTAPSSEDEIEKQAPQVGEEVPADLLLKAKATLLTIPLDIHIIIFTLLDRASSTCLGLTSKVLYPVHIKIRGYVPLSAYCVLPPRINSGKHLVTLLTPWMGDLVLCPRTLKFVTKERREEVRRERKEGRIDFRWAEALYVAKVRDVTELGGYWRNGYWVTVG